MAEAAACDFDEWLRDTLVALDTDDEVFSPYIKGILEGEENPDEKLDALQGILSEITVRGGRGRRVAGAGGLLVLGCAGQGKAGQGWGVGVVRC